MENFFEGASQPPGEVGDALTAEEHVHLENILQEYKRGSAASPIHAATLKRFLLPLLREGLNPKMALNLLESVPRDWPHDHREIYYDFRLRRWMRILEPPSLEACLREHLENSLTRRQAYGHILRSLWRSLF